MTSFTRSQTVQELYFLAEALVETVPYSIAFWVNDLEIEDADNLTLEATWKTGKGIYLFLKAIPEGDNGIDHLILSDRIREFLSTPAVGNTRFLWIDNPHESVARWKFHALTLLPTELEPEQSIIRVVERLTFFNFRNYELAIAPGVECRLNQTKDGFVFALDSSIHNLPNTEPELGKREPFYFSTGYGANRLKGIKVNENREAITLPLTGALAGCLNFALNLHNLAPGNQPFAELIQMDIALRMFFKSANSTLDLNDPFSGFTGFNTEQDFLISSHRYPFLGEDSDASSHYSKQEDSSQNLTLYASLDPIGALNSDRTYFAFVESGNSQNSELSLPSCYRTNLGYTIHLTPHSHNDSRLIFAELPSQSASVFDAPFYLVPTGKYTLSVPHYNTTPIPSGKDLPIRDVDNFLCGLAGIEYIQLSSQSLNILHLKPGQPAFARDFIPNQIAENDQAEQRLESRATTAWAYIEHAEAINSPIYFSQPKQSLLYRASTFQDGDQNATNDPLRFLEVPVTGLPTEEYLPLFPYGGVSGKLAHYQQMEEQILNPQRRQRIKVLTEIDNTPLISTAQGISSTPVVSLNVPSQSQARVMTANAAATVTPETSITGTTAQGLLATYSSDYEILDRLLLAKDTDGKELSFQGLERRANLRSAFGSSQMFLVITDPSSLKTFDTSEPPQVIKEYFQNNQLTIEGWKFNLDPDNWRQNQGDGTNTVLIFKFLDKPMLEILKDTALWEQPDIFVATDSNLENQGKQIKEVCDRLVKFFEDAIKTAEDPNASEKDRDNAAPLARVGSSTFWSGMIALNVSLPTDSGLPQELRALECGIQDADNFYAQYVGSNGTPILPKNGQLEAEQSSLFGLLDYQDNSVPETGPSGYAFQVSSLRVQFQNSQISAFSSEVNLTLDKLFGEATLLLNSRSRRNIVILKGFTEEHNGVTTYAFSFSGENYFALPDSYILNTVDIVKAEFATDPDSQEVTIGRFTLWGRFNFRNLAEIDLLSFGIETPPDQELLNFNDFEDNPGKLALTALEVLNRKGLIDDNQQAQNVLTDYSNLIASGEEIRDGITAIQDRALEAFQLLNPEILTIEDEDVELAVKASKISQTLKLLDDNDQFLPFSKVVIIMECNNAGDTTFFFDSSQIAFDLVKSKVRTDSLYAKFPLKLVNFVELDPNKIDSQPKGYLPVKTPLGSAAMPTNGFGLNFELNLGSLGALAGAAQFVVNLLVIWEPNSDGSQEKAKTFVGLRLPGIGGDVLGFPLQSVLKLSFKTLELIVDHTNNNAAYLLKIKKIALKFFVLSFPPNGQTEIVIFGNPNATDSNDAVGWYAAYAKEQPATPEGQSSGRASPAR